MAFSFSASNPAGATASAELGPELAEIYTDEVGFQGLSKEPSIRFLPNAWPEDALPAPTSSLLAVAHTKGLIVGAGPDALVVSTVEVIRNSIEASSGEKLEKTKTTIPLASRPTHVAFTPGDDGLILATENGDSLSVFDTNTLVQGNAQPALSIPTKGLSLRALVPNPDPTSTLVALVSVGGDLLIADLKKANFVTSPNGSVLKDNVSCVSWSNKGKQLVAGLADGTGYQMAPDGAKKAEIPKPSDLEGDCHVSSISWLENDVFLITYTPNALEDDMGGNPESSYYIITRRAQQPFLIQKLPGICSPMGFSLKRSPAFQFIARIRDYKPHLKDALIVASTASGDVELLTRSDQALADDDEARSHVGQFTVTSINEDTRKASVPLRESVADTSVIGLALNLSATNNVITSLPGPSINEDSETNETSRALPGILLLNNDGILSSWWFIYADSIRQNVPYSGLTSSGRTAQAQPQAPVQNSGFGQSSFGAPTPKQPAFGNTGSASPFGSLPAMPAQTMSPSFGKPTAPGFGSPSPLHGNTSVGTPSSGPKFGAPSTPGVSFGQTGFGAHASTTSKSSAPVNPFGTPSTDAKGGGFGAFSGGGGFGAPASTASKSSAPANPFGTPSTDAKGGGFGAFSGGGGFGGFASAKAGESPFAKPAGDSSFGASTAGQSPFAKLAGNASAIPKPAGGSPFGASTTAQSPFAKPSSFPPAPSIQNNNTFGNSSGGFQLKSSFVPDAPTKDADPKSEKSSAGAFSFGSSLNDMLPSSGRSSPSESMDDTEDVEPVDKSTFSIFGGAKKPDSQTPTSMFGSNTQPKAASSVDKKAPFSMFGSTSDRNALKSSFSAPSDKTETPKKDQSISSIDAATPLPPDSTSRASYAAGDTSASSNVSKSSLEDAPLPPDFTQLTKSSPKPQTDAPLPPDFMTKKAVPETDDVPLPPDFLTTPKKPETPAVSKDDAPLPPDFTAPQSQSFEEAVPIPGDSEGSDESEGESEAADEPDFNDSGEEITHDEAQTAGPKPSAESSFGVLSDKSSSTGLFGGPTKSAKEKGHYSPQQLLGGIPKQPLLPPPSPAGQKNALSFPKPRTRQGSASALHSRKESLTHLAERDGHLKKSSEIARKEQEAQNRAHAAAQEQEEGVLYLSDEDEDDRLRDDLAQPVEPVDTLDPFLPHQDYMGEIAKPGIAGQIERLYRDINSMVDTLGINARSLAGFLLHQQPKKQSNLDEWVMVLNSDQPADILDTKMVLKDIERFEALILSIEKSLNDQRVQGVDEKLDVCHDLLTKQIVTLLTQLVSIRKILDAHTDSIAILEAPLSAEQGALQHDLRTTFTHMQAQTVELEQVVSLLRAKLADVSQVKGAGRNRPTVEAVTKTIGTMMSMVEGKRTEIDVLEAQMRRLGVDVATAGPTSREGSPFTTPRKGIAGRIPTTPGSRGSIDRSAYHTPESASRGINFRSSVNGLMGQSRLRSVEGADEHVLPQEDVTVYKAKKSRRQHLNANLKQAFEDKQAKVREVDDW